MKENIWGKILTWKMAVLELILAVAGISGGYKFISDPSGSSLGMSTDLLAKTPVNNFLLPGLFLFMVMGIFPLVAFVGALLRRGRKLSLAVGTLLVAWILFEWLVIPVHHSIQLVFGLLGLLICLLSLVPPVKSYFRLST